MSFFLDIVQLFTAPTLENVCKEFRHVTQFFVTGLQLSLSDNVALFQSHEHSLTSPPPPGTPEQQSVQQLFLL